VGQVGIMIQDEAEGWPSLRWRRRPGPSAGSRR